MIDDVGSVARLADHHNRLEAGDRPRHLRVVQLGLPEQLAPQAPPGGPGHEAALMRFPLGRHPESFGPRRRCVPGGTAPHASRYLRDNGTSATGSAATIRPPRRTVPSARSTVTGGHARPAIRLSLRTDRVPDTATSRRSPPIRAAMPASIAARETNVADNEAGVRPSPPQCAPYRRGSAPSTVALPSPSGPQAKWPALSMSSGRTPK